jgi:REP-associated tyrosine transposase
VANTFTSLNYHVVFSTKNREPWLTPSIRERLWPYLGGIARENGMKALEIGGVGDHAHLLLAVPANMAVSKAIQLIKGGSSHWLKSEFPNLAGFAWQDGYGAFTVSQSRLDAVRRYMRQQPEHHRTRTFAEEYRAFLKQHGIEFNEKFLLG